MLCLFAPGNPPLIPVLVRRDNPHPLGHLLENLVNRGINGVKAMTVAGDTRR